MRGPGAVRRFHTGLVAIDRDLKGLGRPIRGGRWRARFARCSRHTRIFPQGRELFIEASSWIAAQRALNLIWTSVGLLLHEPYLMMDDHSWIAHRDDEPQLDWVSRHTLDGGGGSFEGIPQATTVAARASRQRRWTYAVAHYAFSIRAFAVYQRALEPPAVHLPVSPFLTDHVAFSHAIVAAYASIENAGLELRASREKPSRIKGLWNPEVKADLESRLIAAGVSLTKGMPWTVRGRATAIHKLRRLTAAERMPWASGPYVRDGRVEVVDAIAYADWLRDRVAAHAAKKLTASISPYDVANVQALARRLVLTRLRAWPPPMLWPRT